MQRALFHHGLRVGLFVFGLFGSVLGLASALIIPAFQFRHNAERDATTFAVIAICALFLAAAEAGIVAAYSASKSGSLDFVPVRRRAVVLAFAMPVAVMACAVEARMWLLEHDDGLYQYVERGLSKHFAQRGIGSEITLQMEEGRLTLAVPTYMERRGKWWVEVDAHDTLGRSCPLRAAAIFGDEPTVLRIPVPLASDEIPGRKFDIDPGAIVVVRGVRLTLEAKGPEPPIFVREFEKMYEAPQRLSRKLDADFVSH